MKADLRKEELNGRGQFRLLSCQTANLLYYSGAKIPQFTQLNVALQINIQDSKIYNSSKQNSSLEVHVYR